MYILQLLQYPLGIWRMGFYIGITRASTSSGKLSGTLEKTLETPHMVDVLLVCQYVDTPPLEPMTWAMEEVGAYVRTVAREDCSGGVCELRTGVSLRSVRVLIENSNYLK